MVEGSSQRLGEGRALVEDDRLAEAIDVFDEVIVRYGTSTDTATKRDVADALIDKAETLERLGRDEDALAAFNSVLERYGTAPEPALHRRIAWSLMSRGVLLARLDRGIGALTCYDEVVRRFGDSTDTELQDLVAQALMRSGYLLSERGDYQRAVEAADALRSRPEAGRPEWRAPVAWATLNKGLALSEL